MKYPFILFTAFMLFSCSSNKSITKSQSDRIFDDLQSRSTDQYNSTGAHTEDRALD